MNFLIKQLLYKKLKHIPSSILDLIFEFLIDKKALKIELKTYFNIRLENMISKFTGMKNYKKMFEYITIYNIDIDECDFIDEFEKEYIKLFLKK
jgi:hypothetical protein